MFSREAWVSEQQKMDSVHTYVRRDRSFDAPGSLTLFAAVVDVHKAGDIREAIARLLGARALEDGSACRKLAPRWRQNAECHHA